MRFCARNANCRIEDPFFRFWFRYIFRNAQLVELERFETLRKMVAEDLDYLEIDKLILTLCQNHRLYGDDDANLRVNRACHKIQSLLNRLYTVLCKSMVARHHGKIVEQCCRDDETIRRIFMNLRQRRGAK